MDRSRIRDLGCNALCIKTGKNYQFTDIHPLERGELRQRFDEEFIACSLSLRPLSAPHYTLSIGLGIQVSDTHEVDTAVSWGTRL
jgi:hypothetical protein